MSETEALPVLQDEGEDDGFVYRAGVGAGGLRLRNPIFARELLTILRQPRGFALLAITLLISTLAVVTSWPSNPEGIVGQGALSRRLFELFGYAQMIILAFVVPGTLGAAMTTEKEKETIDLLLTTPLTGGMIVTGKLFSGLSYILLIGLASVPVLMLCSVIGGLSGEDVLRLYAVLACQGLAYGLTALACSGLSSRTVMAVMIAYVLVAFEAAVFWFALDDVGGTVIRTLVFGIPAAAVAAWASRRPYNPVPKPPEERDPHTTAGLVLRPDAFPDKLMLPRKYKGVLPDGLNPVHRKELQAGIHGSGARFVRVLIQLGLVLGLVVFLVALFKAASTEAVYGRAGTNATHIFIVFAAGFGMTLGPAIGARAFSGEREEGTAEMLCLTLMPRKDMVVGKFTACLRVVATLTAINCVPFLGYALLSVQWFQIGILALAIYCVSVTSIAVGFLCSLVTPTTVAAMFRSYVVLFVLWIGPGLAGAFFEDLPPWLELSLRVLTPFNATDVSFAGRTSFPWVDVVCLGGHVLLCTVATGILLWVCTVRFDTYMRQASERS